MVEIKTKNSRRRWYTRWYNTKVPRAGQKPVKDKKKQQAGTHPVDKNKDGVDDKTGAEVDADGDGKNDVTKKPVKRTKTGGKVKGQVSDTDSAKYQRDRRAKLKQQQKDANKDGKDDATGQPIQQEPATAGQQVVKVLRQMHRQTILPQEKMQLHRVKHKEVQLLPRPSIN